MQKAQDVDVNTLLDAVLKWEVAPTYEHEVEAFTNHADEDMHHSVNQRHVHAPRRNKVHVLDTVTHRLDTEHPEGTPPHFEDKSPPQPKNAWREDTQGLPASKPRKAQTGAVWPAANVIQVRQSTQTAPSETRPIASNKIVIPMEPKYPAISQAHDVVAITITDPDEHTAKVTPTPRQSVQDLLLQDDSSSSHSVSHQTVNTASNKPPTRPASNIYPTDPRTYGSPYLDMLKKISTSSAPTTTSSQATPPATPDRALGKPGSGIIQSQHQPETAHRSNDNGTTDEDELAPYMQNSAAFGLLGNAQQSGTQPNLQSPLDRTRLTELIACVTFGEDHEIIQAACRTLLGLTRIAENREIIHSFDGLHQLMRYVRELCVDAGILSENTPLSPTTPRYVLQPNSRDLSKQEYECLVLAISTIYNLAFDDTNRAILAYEGFMIVIIALFRQTSIDRIHELCAGLLGNMALSHSAYRTEIGHLDAIPLLLTASQSSTSSSLVQLSVAALWSLACNNRRNRTEIIMLRGVAILLSILQSSPPTPVLQQALGLLANLVWKSETTAQQICEHNGMDIMISILRDSTDVACLYHAILTLGQIGKAPSRKGSLMAKHFFGLLDGLLKANPHDRLFSVAASTIWNLSHKDALTQRRVQETELIRTLSSASKTVKSPSTFIRVCGALGGLCENPLMRREVMEHQVITTIINYTKQLERSQDMMRCCQALRAIVRGDLNEALVKMCVYTLKANKSARVLTAIATIVWDMAHKAVGNCLPLVQYGSFEAFFFVLRHSENKHVVDRILSATNAMLECPQTAICFDRAGGVAVLTEVAEKFVTYLAILENVMLCYCMLASLRDTRLGVARHGGVEVSLRIAKLWSPGQSAEQATLMLSAVELLYRLALSDQSSHAFLEVAEKHNGFGVLLKLCSTTRDQVALKRVVEIILLASRSPRYAAQLMTLDALLVLSQFRTLQEASHKLTTEMDSMLSSAITNLATRAPDLARIKVHTR